MRHHQYADKDDFPLSTCIHCGRKTGLHAHQMESMPLGMARCESKSAPRMTLWKWLLWIASPGVDCWLHPSGTTRKEIQG